MKGCLPDWITMGYRTRDFYKWLGNSQEYMADFSGRFFMKGTIQDCVLIYGSQKNTDDMEEFHLTQLCGIFRKSDATLYEASPVLYQSIGIPKEFCFPDKESMQGELEKKVTLSGRKLLDTSWDQLVLKSGCTKEQLIPVINREQIRITARRYFQIGKKAQDIYYLPQFSFSSVQGGFTDKLFLHYLNAEQETVKDLTDVWLMSHLSEISMKKIYYGCVKEEMEAMEKTRYRDGTWKNL